MDWTVAVEDVDRAMQLADSYTRLPTLLERGALLSDRDFFALLGDWWDMCDNVAEYSDELADAIGSRRPVDVGATIFEMMNEVETATFNSLPPEVTIYRGCYAHNKYGLSWSTERAVAERFPFLHRYRHPGRPLLVKAVVRRERITAMKLGRDESEIILFARPKVVAIYTARSIELESSIRPTLRSA